MTSMAKLLTAAAVLCAVLCIGGAPATAAIDTTTRSACDRIAKARTISGVDRAKVQAAADEVARSRALGARTVADQLDASLAQDSRAQASALRAARIWCDRTTTTTTKPAPTTAPFVDPQHYEGDGDGEVTLPADMGAALARIAVRDSQRFTVESVGVDDRPLGTVVDTTQTYTGTRPLNFETGPTAAHLRVTTDGVWTIDVVDLDEAPRLRAPGHYDGVGDQVVFVGGDPSHATFHATATNGRFVVDGYGIFKAPIVDEPSPYRATVVLPREAGFVLEIRADGPWSADLS